MPNAQAASLPATPAPAHAKPLLRGYLHAAAALAAVVCTILLAVASADDRPKQVSLVIYGASSILLFGWSAFYHLGNWTPRVRKIFQRIDHANIFVLIAGTYTPIAFNLLSGGGRVALLAIIWTLAALGMAAAAPTLRIPRQVMAGLYIAMGWVALGFLPQIASAVGPGPLLLMALGGVLYTLGALAYATHWPDPWPRVFGYHEVFHLATIAAAASFLAFVVREVLPYVRH
ncbi:MAG: hemolysin III family protein [Chloroflexota bacterium]|nr:hemolysin III family protein [Chloroflexota bacterium]